MSQLMCADKPLHILGHSSIDEDETDIAYYSKCALIRAWNTVVTERNERMKTWTAKMAGDDLLAAFYAEQFTELTASGHLMQDIDLGIVAKVLDRVVFYGEHLDFYLLDSSKVTVKLDE